MQKKENISVVPALVKRMLERNIFLFGFVDINEASVTVRVNEITNMQNAQMQVAYEKLLANTLIEHFLHMDLGTELDLKLLKKMSTEIATAKELAIIDAVKVVDIQNIKHIAENKKPIGDVMERIADEWNARKETFHQRTGFNQRQSEVRHQVALCPSEEEQEVEVFGMELEQILSRSKEMTNS